LTSAVQAESIGLLWYVAGSVIQTAELSQSERLFVTLLNPII
jgi:hypothetical protein